MVKVRRILLQCDPEEFEKFKNHKAKKERELEMEITWEDYFFLLFGFYKRNFRK